MTKRINFGKLKEVLPVPDLIGLQLDSYRNFLQKDVPPAERLNQGLHEVFNEMFPIVSQDGKISIQYLGYEVGEPKYDVVDCIKDGRIYDVPLHVEFLLNNDGNETREKVYMCDMPLMTEQGTFVINGAERVIITQLHRSPGICFEKTRHTSGRMLYSYRVIPDRGSWMDVQFDINDYIYIYLDRRRRRRKFYITTFLRAIGYESNRDILAELFEVKKYTVASL
ncbi:MAG: DNA-directed RNA polymerase subunit beta, partial [Lentisphaeria bacterium]|nr:DNA-directed RNA polymerase subunit beta [Lentisphaeria bacterium]